MFIVKKLVFQPCFLLEVIKKGEIMGVNKKFTSAVIVIFVVGFVGSFFIPFGLFSFLYSMLFWERSETLFDEAFEMFKEALETKW